jgi:FtsP/CotA-like multicopper oxidase with cupredoxin domain
MPRATLSILLLGMAGCAAAAGSAGITRTYYVAADELVWDYAPTDSNLITGKQWEGFEPIVMLAAEGRIGRKYKKAIYREYTDSSFTTLKPRASEWEHLGILGPLLRAVVGDTIRVVFRNNGSYPYSMHPHGVFYTKDSEGAPYADGTTGADKGDDGVPPGGTHVYLWPVPERAGPAPGEISSVQWMYHSHAREDADLNTGLIGPMLVTGRGKARADGSPVDVDREFVVSFAELDENSSWFLDHNLTTYAPDPTRRPKIGDFSDLGFIANLRETMNGLSYGHLQGLTMRVGERVRWYLFATTSFEVHAPHWHGNTVIANHMRTDVTNINTMQMVTADMVPDNPGIWLFHCHVQQHLLAGMQAVYRVE